MIFIVIFYLIIFCPYSWRLVVSILLKIISVNILGGLSTWWFICLRDGDPELEYKEIARLIFTWQWIGLLLMCLIMVCVPVMMKINDIQSQEKRG